MSHYKQAIGSTNCMQCCVGFLLGLPLEQVPHFMNDGGWELFEEYASSQGYSAVMLPGNREFEADYLASGNTERGTSHMVVMNDGKLIHDPHPSNAGLVDVQCVWLFAKRAAQPKPNIAPKPGERCKHCIDLADGFYGSWAPDCPYHYENGKPRAIQGVST
ncbi:hypothetical protein [Acidovorax radicis]|uniref:hypothetical protein n=1 Tax=Acidovorax radicis TaxID=758826 RepID=UPI001CF9DE9C|nr:hypothetical protein [Acidovorax radicis]UCV00252.1 hypothetical protein KI609_05560 [Acidovorax radicis]